ncbi:MAG TPA: hypothetical protein VFU98_13210 [Microlunatus sp.]|nr:hypothetical protein [Microlunatus sp.]
MTTYEVRVSGDLSSALLQELENIRAVQAAGTTLEVDVPDDAALWGLIDALRRAGVDLLELRRRESGPDQ